MNLKSIDDVCYVLYKNVSPLPPNHLIANSFAADKIHVVNSSSNCPNNVQLMQKKITATIECKKLYY